MTWGAWLAGGAATLAAVFGARALFAATPAIPRDPAAAQPTLVTMGLAVVRRVAPQWSANAALLAIANGWFESYLGGTGSFLLPDGTPSWNWGAVMARKGMKFFNHGDHKADGTPFTGGFAVFPSMADGFAFYKKILPAQSVAAMQTGDAFGMARAMFVAGYYDNVDSEPVGSPRGSTEGDRRRIQGYANALVATAKKIAPMLGMNPNLVTGAEGGHGYVAPTGKG